MHIKKLLFLLLITFLFFTCSKNDDQISDVDNPTETIDSISVPKDTPSIPNRALSALGKKLIGKWRPFVYSTSPNDFWEFKDVIIDSISNNSVTYRQYVDSIVSSYCTRQGRWYEKDSVLYGTCVPNAKIIKLTNDTLIFRYSAYGANIDYKWKRIQ